MDEDFPFSFFLKRNEWEEEQRSLQKMIEEIDLELTQRETARPN